MSRSMNTCVIFGRFPQGIGIAYRLCLLFCWRLDIRLAPVVFPRSFVGYLIFYWRVYAHLLLNLIEAATVNNLGA
jgi:hypothetical protein